MTTLQLPSYRDIGQTRKWFLPLQAEDDYYITVARYIGYGSSHTENHWDHTGPYIERNPNSTWPRCNACRWFEIRIFREIGEDVKIDPDGDLNREYATAVEADQLGSYIVHKVGMSIVPDEVPLCRYDEIRSPYEVVEALTTRQVRNEGARAFITKPSAMALASGAQFDADLADAYVNRAVS